MTEIIGYTGSFLVALSLLMSNVFKLRLINALGALFFIFYSINIKAYAVFSVNAFIFLVDIYYIYLLKSKTEIFKFIKVNNEDTIFKYFISYNLKDIMKFFPRFIERDLKETKCFLIMRNLIPVGVFIFTNNGDKVEIILDYIIREYRDLKNAMIFFNSSQIREEFKNVKILCTKTDIPEHIKYIKKIGFEEQEPFVFIKKIN